jgi:Cd2+/Zn2+-exporting ATPase
MIEDQTGRASKMIIITLIGGVLLITASVAKLFFTSGQADMLALVAALMLGVPLIFSALKELAEGHSHMDELVALGVAAAIANGEFIEAGIIAFFMIISSLIEHRTALGARKSIESLIKITPTRARKLVDGQEQEVDAADLRPGDVVRVLPGDNIPGDGVIRSGSSTVNQANITGESLPVDKSEGDEVFGGTINVTGAMDVEINKAGEDTTLGRVQELILKAEQSRSPIMRIADQYASWYTPVVLMLCAVVFFFTKDMDRVISLLIIACPCAIILSTPTAMVAALSAAARLGILVKNVANLEVARNLTAIVFDKTGTLTTGELSVSRLTPVEGVDAAELLAAAAAVEQNSRHPVARAVVDVARRARVNISSADQFNEIGGRGVSASVDGQRILVGRDSFVAEQGVDVTAIDRTGSEGLSLLFVARGDKLLGWIGLEDRTRPDAARAMDDLRQQNVKQLTMVTGDRWSVARRVAAEMHCTDVQAEVLPAQKLDIVDQLKAKGHTVAVIGDGVNDAPALAAGDISVAMGAAGSDVAIHSASIALMNNNLNRVPFLVQLSRRAFNVVRQNMIFAVFYIVIGAGLSIAGQMPPIVAALLHAASSIIVVFNSARLVREGEDLEHAEGQVTGPTTRGAKPADAQAQPQPIAPSPAPAT